MTALYAVIDFVLLAIGYLAGLWHGAVHERNKVWDSLDAIQQKRDEEKRSREQGEARRSLW